MKAEWIKLEKNTGELHVSVDGTTWQHAQEKALKKLAQNVKVDGFRKGKVPESMVKAQIGSKAILEEAVDVALQEIYSGLLKDNNIKPIAQPSLKVEAITTTELKVVFTFEVEPEVVLGQYKDIEIKKPEVVVTKEDIDEKIAKLQEEFSELLIKEEGVVELGDTAVIDFEGFKDGIAFDGGKGENHPLVIGSNSFIPGFEAQVEGMGLNEVKDIHVTFPEEYQAEDLAGKEVVFKVTLNEIKSKKLPELNDDFALDTSIEGVDTYEQLRAHVEKELLAEKTKQAENEYNNQLFQIVMDNATVDVPETMIQEEMNNMLLSAKDNMERQGFKFDMYLSMVGKTEDEVKEEFRTQATDTVKFTLVMNEIVKAEKIKATEEDINEQLQKMAEMYSLEVDAIRKTLVDNGYIDRLISDIAIQKAMELVKNSTK